MSLTDKRVVVVGGTSGMGLATARLAAELGATVVAAGRRRFEERDPLAGVTHAHVDTTDEASVKALFDEVGELDHLFVSSSPGSPGPLLEQDLTSARSFIDGKLLGSWMCARYAAPRMGAGGSITFVTGCAVLRPPPHAAMVVAAFAAVEALSRALALELGPLRVNAIRPGYTDSEMWSGLPPGERDRLRQLVAATVPVGRMGTPDDIAHAAVFLMTNRQTTGAVLEVSGGEPLVEPVEVR
jgi:NAD(P)-dependent dehydrogenase (short-subunit alcohol dehydrogenase family)